ncbi:hypothetical protein ACFO25_20535 [Paenactinomyces guangxiensis]|uniref:hypothetical protein n=1 Tax=Paenactinomyces guangxiensis TaxID=1490290 RepID=UPI001E2C4FE2|nr:hypothetical protein [Paenactinomyces guangxiensis]
MKRLWRVMKKSFPATFRFFLGLQFLIYGLAKIVIGQFAAIEPTHKIAGLHPDPEGFALAWTFFAYSRTYEILIGIGEITAALLIMIPRTSTLGAAIYFPIAANVLAVNYFYGVGVTDLSLVLVMMNLVLLWVDRKKLLMIFWKTNQIERHLLEMKKKGEQAA